VSCSSIETSRSPRPRTISFGCARCWRGPYDEASTERKGTRGSAQGSAQGTAHGHLRWHLARTVVNRRLPTNSSSSSVVDRTLEVTFSVACKRSNRLAIPADLMLAALTAGVLSSRRFQQPPTFASLSCDLSGPRLGPSLKRKVAIERYAGRSRVVLSIQLTRDVRVCCEDFRVRWSGQPDSHQRPLRPRARPRDSLRRLCETTIGLSV